MSKKIEDNFNPYNISNKENKESIDEMMKRKKARKREKNIQQRKKIEKQDDIDFETDTVIQMTNRNNKQKEEMRRKRREKEERKRAKKIKKIKFIIKFVLLIGIIAGGITFALTSPIFNITDIKVVNNNKIPSETIESLSEIKTGENIFKFYKNKVEEAIEKNPYIESAKIHRKLPNVVEIDVTERVAKYSVDYMGKYAYINTQGYILEISDDSQSLPIIQGATTKEESFELGSRLNNDDLERLEDVIQIMDATTESGLNNEVTSIDISNKNEYSIYLEKEKKKVHIGDTSNLSNKMLYVQSIIEKEKDKEGDIFVNGDLNNGFNPYFREKV